MINSPRKNVADPVGSNLQPPDRQSDTHLTEPPKLATEDLYQPVHAHSRKSSLDALWIGKIPRFQADSNIIHEVNQERQNL